LVTDVTVTNVYRGYTCKKNKKNK